ncbi:hypothetical protein Snas_6417 [Stackebrandtia nassauensis DSM 44728]|uniref:ABC-type phosphate transport system periplasmic component-like protein n=2 Tax=Stackebrandtia TaxID=283810 RepID=D3Q5H3_STANL|nr:hypothetical protein Snas_6417 [Stackebrandtia nassauensis DSM 44728]
MVAVLAPVAGVALGSAIGDVKDCGEEVKVDVAAAPEIAPVLADYAKSWTATAAPSKGVCVSVEVKPMDSASVAAGFAKKHGVDLDLGGSPVNRVELPDVWVPESMTWLARLGGDLKGVLAADEVSSVAESRVGLAVPESKEGDNPPTGSWGDATVTARDPRVDAASLALAIGSVKDSKAKPSFDADGLEVVSNAQWMIHNKENPGDKWTFVEPSPPLRPFDYPYVTLSKQDDELRKATEAFKSALVSDKFTGPLSEHGMSKAGPYPQPVAPEDVEAALKQKWA